jgi:hypothetical protein
MTDSLETIQREADQSLRRSHARRQGVQVSTFGWTFLGFMIVVVGVAISLLVLGVVSI